MMGGKYLLTADYKMYQMTFFIGYPLGLIFYVAICNIWPPSSVGIQENLPEIDESDVASTSIINGNPAIVDDKDAVITIKTE